MCGAVGIFNETLSMSDSDVLRISNIYFSVETLGMTWSMYVTDWWT